MALLTQKEYAARRRVTPQYINKCVRDGKITLVNGRIDPDRADRELGRHTPRKRGGAKSKRSGEAPAGRPARGSATHSLTEERAEKMRWEALTAKRNYELSVGLLLPRADVLEAERRKNANFKLQIRRLARALAPTLARITNPSEIEAVMLAEIDARLEVLAADPLGMAAPVPSAEPSVVPVDVLRTSAELPPPVPPASPEVTA